jgi:hypothetical protein
VILATFLFVARQSVALPRVEDAYSNIERELDRAHSLLVSAGRYTCQSDSARAALSPFEVKLDDLERQAEAELGRQLNLDILLNSCLREGDGPAFRSLLQRANWHLRKASKLISKGA